MFAEKLFTKENLDNCLKELAKEFRKMNGNREQRNDANDNIFDHDEDEFDLGLDNEGLDFDSSNFTTSDEEDLSFDNMDF